MRNNNIALPHQVQVESTHLQGPLAQPAMVTLQQPGGIKLLLVGGLTKVEALAGQIVAGMVASGSFDGSVAVANAVTLAEAILDECERRRAEVAPK